MIYTTMSLPFLAAALLLALFTKWRFGLGLRKLLLPTIGLLLLTAIFDNLIVMAGIVTYNQESILGIKLGAAPIEDFFYSLAAVPLVASLWRILDRRNRR